MTSASTFSCLVGKYFLEQLQAAETVRRTRLDEALSSAERAFKSGDQNAYTARFLEALSYLPIKEAARNALVAQLGQLAVVDAGKIKNSADTKAARPILAAASNRLEAEKILATHQRPFVIKNPLCSPTSPVHTVLCETVADTRAWLRHVNYAEGVFLQEYLGRAEAGHIVLVSDGEIHSLVGENGAGKSTLGLVERDENDKYGLERELIHPLKPWLRSCGFNGPLQVTAIKKGGRWHVIEYNIRIGVTSGPMILRMLTNPVETVLRTARNQPLSLSFREGLNFGCSLTLAGYGYPYTQVQGPHLPLEVTSPFDTDVWWNEVSRDADGHLLATGHRIADVIALAPQLDGAIRKAYENIRRIRVVGSYYRTDVGQSLWPPGTV